MPRKHQPQQIPQTQRNEWKIKFLSISQGFRNNFKTFDESGECKTLYSKLFPLQLTINVGNEEMRNPIRTWSLIVIEKYFKSPKLSNFKKAALYTFSDKNYWNKWNGWLKCLIWSWLVLKRRENINLVAAQECFVYAHTFMHFIRITFFCAATTSSHQRWPTVWNYKQPFPRGEYAAKMVEMKWIEK